MSHAFLIRLVIVTEKYYFSLEKETVYYVKRRLPLHRLCNTQFILDVVISYCYPLNKLSRFSAIAWFLYLVRLSMELLFIDNSVQKKPV